MNRQIELLSPAGDLEKLKTAIIYGADAVYIGGSNFGLRAASKNFTDEEMMEGIEFAHSRGKKVYVTCNIIPHNEDLKGLEEYLLKLEEMKVDAIIVSDPGLFMIARQTVPEMEIHISTQANNTNYQSALFWYNQGAKRIVTARELSFEEVKEIHDRIPEDMSIESFVHGAMCISYSGRCLISNYMTGRDANRGECAHPCRWNYALMEQNRPGEYYPVEQDERGTYFFNSKDLCMIEFIPQLVEAGITSFKIEGRVKTAYYVATVTRAYRMAIDAYLKDPENYKFDPEWMEELKKASYRDFTTGFYEEKPDSEAQNYGSSSYIRNYDFIGVVRGYDEEKALSLVEVRNRIFTGDDIEIIGPGKETKYVKVASMKNSDMEEMEVAPRPMELLWMDLGTETGKEDILRKRSV
ncbi:MAG: U32 family peptidase [Filifactor alocis]|nr:U32 family peptidase [Filifactor alocis]